MESAVNKVEMLFNKVDSDLNVLEQKLDFKFSERSENINEVNPIKILHKLEEVKQEYSKVLKDVAAITEEQKIVMCELQQLLSGLNSKLERLQNKTNQILEDDVKEELLQLMSTPGIAQIMSFEGSTDRPEEKCVTTKELNFSTPKERSCNDLISVSEEEFNSVSSLVRGRVKLEDVNLVYQQLHSHFKQKKSSLLTVQEMTNLGMKVTGATGEARLKVLRALKLIHISCKGEVKLLN